MNYQEIVSILNLEPHPEGGYYKRTYCSDVTIDSEFGERGTASAIYYLIEGGFTSRKHKTDGDELWLWHAGAPLRLDIADGDASTSEHILGMDLVAGERPQINVPANQWQSATSLGDWTLVSCVVSPEFHFDGFVMAED